jgi:polyisoprenoid-binding protein YceI
MNKKIILITISLFSVFCGIAQKKYLSTKTGQINFDAGTGVEEIKAVNKSVTTVIDPATGKIEFSLLVKGFEFKNALMQDHFNENYMESEKYPKSTFKGTITNIDKVNFTQNGTYPVSVKGTLEMHGVKKEILANGKFNVSGSDIIATSDFTILLEDFEIQVPKLVGDKLASKVKILLKCNYKPLN